MIILQDIDIRVQNYISEPQKPRGLSDKTDKAELIAQIILK